MTNRMINRSYRVANVELGKNCGHTHSFPALVKCLCRHNRINEGWVIVMEEDFWNGRYTVKLRNLTYNEFPEEIKKELEKCYKNHRMAHTLNLPETIETSLNPPRNAFTHTVITNGLPGERDVPCSFCGETPDEILMFDRHIFIFSCRKCIAEFRAYINSLELNRVAAKKTKTKKK